MKLFINYKKANYTIICFIIVILCLQFVPMLSFRTLSMVEQKIEGFNVFYEPDDKIMPGILVKELILNRKIIEHSLNRSTNEVINLYIYPSIISFHVKRFGTVVGILLPEWIIGDNTSNDILIVSPLRPGKQHSYESIIKACVHEYVHVLSYRINPEIDKWLKEGLAVYLSGQKPQKGLLSTISSSDFSNINGLRFADIGGYQLSYYLVEYITINYGFNKVIELVITGSDYNKVFNKDKRVIFNEWMKYLSVIND